MNGNKIALLLITKLSFCLKGKKLKPVERNLR